MGPEPCHALNTGSVPREAPTIPLPLALRGQLGLHRGERWESVTDKLNHTSDSECQKPLVSVVAP